MDGRGLALHRQWAGGNLFVETHATGCYTASNEAMDISNIIIND